MWEKIKNGFVIFGSAVAVIFLTFICFLVCRRDSDGQRSSDDNERDRAIQEGITGCEGRAERIENGISRAEDGIGRCEEHLQRAEDILRNAIERSKKGKQDIEDVSDSNNND